MPPRRREDDWHYGFIWGACGGAMLIALAASPVFSWGDGFGRPRSAVASARPPSQPTPLSSLPRSQQLSPNALAAMAPSESDVALVRALEPTEHETAESAVDSDPGLPTPDSSLVLSASLVQEPVLAAEPPRHVEPARDLTLRGKITRLHGGWLNRQALFAAIAKVRAEGHACERASSSKQQTPLTLRFVLRASGAVESVHAVKPRDSRRPLFVCAKETLKELRLPRPRGGVAHLEAVVRLSPRSRR